MNSNEIDIHGALKKYFGFSQFKGLQENVIRSVIGKQNTFVIMPTGGGKSLCYQLPAIMLEGTAIVVSPLIALMKDQVDGLVARGVRFVAADLDDAAAVAAACAGAETVFHVAAKVGVWGRYGDFHRANVLGTRAILAAEFARHEFCTGNAPWRNIGIEQKGAP
jgi:hypothetical protein